MLEVKQLGYAVGNKQLIQNISLQLQPGRLYGILGPNGSGKSTLLKTMTGIWRATSGQVLWKSKQLLDMPRDEMSRTLSLVPENVSTCFDFTVAEIVVMGRYAHRDFYPCDINDRLEASLKAVDAWYLKDSSILKLSQGERKRVFIARALMSASPVLLFDEPCANLDVKYQLKIWKLLGKLAQSGHLVIAANHNFSATKAFCMEAALLKGGKLVTTGPCSHLFSNQLLAEVFGLENQESTGLIQDLGF